MSSFRVMAARGAKVLLWLLLWVGLALGAFELVYRYQIVDTYRPELRSYNDPRDLEGPAGKATVLVMGDSFSAGTSSYPSIVRRSLIGWRVINSSVPGSGVVEANVLAPRRFAKYRPSVFIYQVFVGNDLLDMRPPVNWGTLPLARNAYWTVARSLPSVRYINYRLGQIWHSAKGPEAPAGPLDEPFAARLYNFREKLLVEADPWHLENQVLVKGDYRGVYERFLASLMRLLSHCAPEACRAYLLVIPHPSQVHRRYLDNMMLLGAKFSDPREVLSDDYPFLAGLRQLLRDEKFGHVHILNPLSALKEREARGERVYYQNNAHLNPLGQQVVSDLVLGQVAWP